MTDFRTANKNRFLHSFQTGRTPIISSRSGNHKGKPKPSLLGGPGHPCYFLPMARLPRVESHTATDGTRLGVFSTSFLLDLPSVVRAFLACQMDRQLSAWAGNRQPFPPDPVMPLKYGY